LKIETDELFLDEVVTEEEYLERQEQMTELLVVKLWIFSLKISLFTLDV
jgi:hypothetical protein